MTPTFVHMLLALVAVVALNVALAFVLAIPARKSREEERAYAEWLAARVPARERR